MLAYLCVYLSVYHLSIYLSSLSLPITYHLSSIIYLSSLSLSTYHLSMYLSSLSLSTYHLSISHPPIYLSIYHLCIYLCTQLSTIK